MRLLARLGVGGLPDPITHVLAEDGRPACSGGPSRRVHLLDLVGRAGELVLDLRVPVPDPWREHGVVRSPHLTPAERVVVNDQHSILDRASPKGKRDLTVGHGLDEPIANHSVSPMGRLGDERLIAEDQTETNHRFGGNGLPHENHVKLLNSP